MANPYKNKGKEHFWRTAVADRVLPEIALIPARRFAMSAQTRIATAGSCFAQNVTRHLLKSKMAPVLMEEEIGADQPLFSALYGNIYTVRQLVQLFDRAHGAFAPKERPWRRDDGRYVDPFRPYVRKDGFARADEIEAARRPHFDAVRNVFAGCDVFVFTLGLTEAWLSAEDGAVFPVAPGVVCESLPIDRYRFHNFSYEDCLADLNGFVDRLREVNPAARILLTVSPVPLTATYTDDHVAVATCRSKSILRAVCDRAESRRENVFYFPSYEIISGHYTKGVYYGENLRSVTADGVADVMRAFERSYLLPAEPQNEPTTSRLFAETDEDEICDDGKIFDSVGF